MCNPTQTRPIKPDRLSDSSEGVTPHGKQDKRPHEAGENKKYVERDHKLVDKSNGGS